MDKDVIDEIRNERIRQVTQEDWAHEHDDQWTEGQLAFAAGCYALHAGYQESCLDNGLEGFWKQPPAQWSFGDGWWKPKDARRDLVRAAALIVAEIERLDRAGIGDE